MHDKTSERRAVSERAATSSSRSRRRSSTQRTSSNAISQRRSRLKCRSILDEADAIEKKVAASRRKSQNIMKQLDAMASSSTTFKDGEP